MLYNKFLYYTNKNIEGKIIIDLKINYDKGFNLNIEKTNELCDYIDLSSLKISDIFCGHNDTLINTYFYKIIDSSKAEEIEKAYLPVKDHKYNIYLYALYYLGINSTTMFEKDIINNYKSNIKSYQRLSICKFVIFIVLILYLIPLYFSIILFDLIIVFFSFSYISYYFDIY